jgi:hypothetical protein
MLAKLLTFLKGTENKTERKERRPKNNIKRFFMTHCTYGSQNKKNFKMNSERRSKQRTLSTPILGPLSPGPDYAEFSSLHCPQCHRTHFSSFSDNAHIKALEVCTLLYPSSLAALSTYPH